MAKSAAGDSKNFITEKILALAGVKKGKSSTAKNSDAYFVGDEELLYFVDDKSLRLHLNEACIKKFGTALKSEARASVDKKNPEWVSLSFASDMDCEFIFLYIRYAWMCWRA